MLFLRPIRSESAPKAGCRQHEEDKQPGHDRAHGLRLHVSRVDQVLLHVRREGVEGERAAHREGEHDEHARVCGARVREASPPPCCASLSADAVSTSERRRYIATTAASAPMTNGMRQPHAFSSSVDSSSCRHSKTPAARAAARQSASRTGTTSRSLGAPSPRPRSCRSRRCRTRRRPRAPARAARPAAATGASAPIVA